MKQRITVEQLKELTDEQKERLIEWYMSVGDYTRTPLLSIGQMIELHEKLNTDLFWPWHSCLFTEGAGGRVAKDYDGELCDALWQSVKEVL